MLFFPSKFITQAVYTPQRTTVTVIISGLFMLQGNYQLVSMLKESPARRVLCANAKTQNLCLSCLFVLPVWLGSHGRLECL